MAEEEPQAEAIATAPTTALGWADARRRLSEARFYWLATVHPDGRPTVRPVLAVWVDGALHTTSNPSARKARNLELDPRCSVTVRSDDLDLVVEGVASRVVDDATLRHIGDAYVSKYEWPVSVHDGAFDAPYGAPTAGPPPYEVHRISPSVVFGFGTDEDLAPRSTRWRF